MSRHPLLFPLAGVLALGAWCTAAAADPLPEACDLLRAADVEEIMDTDLLLQGSAALRTASGNVVTVTSTCNIKPASAPRGEIAPASVTVTDLQTDEPLERGEAWMAERAGRIGGRGSQALESLELGGALAQYQRIGQSQSLYILLRNGQAEAQLSARPAFMSKAQLLELGEQFVEAAAE